MSRSGNIFKGIYRE